MAFEGPISVALIARKPEAVLGTAGINVLMALAIWIESPVIDILSTATALSGDRRAFRILQRFTYYTMIWVTVAHALVAYPPVYRFVTHTILGLDPQVADVVWMPFACLVPWSAMVGWRRYRQGLMIRQGQTRAIGVGTFIRVAMVSIVGFALLQTSLPGLMVAALALLASVTSEAIFMQFASRQIIRELPEEEGDAITMRQVFRFHLPLTGATMVTLSALPMVSAAVSRTPDSVVALASWQLAFTLQWLFRTITFALPEVVITFMRRPDSSAILRRFSYGVGWSLSIAMLAFALSGLDQWVFTNILAAEPHLLSQAKLGLILCSGLPLINAAMAYCRGILTARHRTSARLYAMGVAMVSLIIGLVAGVVAKWPGVVVASVALTLSQVVEWIALMIAVRRSEPILEAA